MHYICEVKYDSTYRLRLTFEDGSIRLADLKDHLDGEIAVPTDSLRRRSACHIRRMI